DRSRLTACATRQYIIPPGANRAAPVHFPGRRPPHRRVSFPGNRGGPPLSSENHTLAVLSLLLVRIRRPSGEKLAQKTSLVCPFSVSSSRPLCASHTFATL